MNNASRRCNFRKDEYSCIVLYCIVLYCIVLYCIVLHIRFGVGGTLNSMKQAGGLDRSLS